MASIGMKPASARFDELRTRFVAFALALVAVFVGTSLTCYAVGMRGLPSLRETFLIRGIEVLQSNVGIIPGVIAMFFLLVAATAAIVKNASLVSFVLRSVESLAAGFLISVLFGTFDPYKGGTLGFSLGQRLVDVMSSPIASLLCGITALLALSLVIEGSLRDFSSIRDLKSRGPVGYGEKTGHEEKPSYQEKSDGQSSASSGSLLSGSLTSVAAPIAPAEPAPIVERFDRAAHTAAIVGMVSAPPPAAEPIINTAVDIEPPHDPEVRLLPKKSRPPVNETTFAPSERESRVYRSRFSPAPPAEMKQQEEGGSSNVWKSVSPDATLPTLPSNNAPFDSFAAEPSPAVSLASDSVISNFQSDSEVAGAGDVFVTNDVSVVDDPYAKPQIESVSFQGREAGEGGVGDADAFSVGIARKHLDLVDEPSAGVVESPGAEVEEVSSSGGEFTDKNVNDGIAVDDNTTDGAYGGVVVETEETQTGAEIIENTEIIENDGVAAREIEAERIPEVDAAREIENYKNAGFQQEANEVKPETPLLKINETPAADLEVSWDLPRTIPEPPPAPKIEQEAEGVFSEIQKAIETVKKPRGRKPKSAETKAKESKDKENKEKEANAKETAAQESFVFDRSPAPEPMVTEAAPVETVVSQVPPAEIATKAPEGSVAEPSVSDAATIPSRVVEPAPVAAQGSQAPPDEASAAAAVVDRAARLVIKERRASISFLQRKLEISLGDAQHVMAGLESAGVVGPYRGNPSRDILLALDEWDARQA